MIEENSQRKTTTLLSDNARWFAHHWAEIVCVIALIFMALNMTSSIRRKSLTNDEVMHIPTGYYYLTERNFRLNAEHPPLVKMWSAVPLLFMNLKKPKIDSGPQTDFETHTMAAAGEFWQTNRESFQSISFWARLPTIALTLGFGAVIFIYARRCFGPRTLSWRKPAMEHWCSDRTGCFRRLHLKPGLLRLSSAQERHAGKVHRRWRSNRLGLWRAHGSFLVRRPITIRNRHNLDG